ncbi:MAG: hypothetical protein L0H84_00880 [Pseudonocardia sp.]|nr:hypothetical protein [Pseudonocardia sp.]
MRYCTREQVKGALDVAETARADTQIDRLIGAASRAVEGLTHRRFYPELATRSFDWPNPSSRRPWRLWLDQHELIELTAIAVDGTNLDLAGVFVEPAADGPPFTRIELDRSATTSSFGYGTTPQRRIAVTGLWGYRADTAPAAQLAAQLTDSATTVDITASAEVGVGSLLQIEDERMQVTGRAMLTTGQTLQAPLTGNKADTSVQVVDGTGFVVGEVVLVDAERMLIVDIASNTLVVRRAFDGSTLAGHTVAATVYAARRLTVTRGVLGTTAVAHLANTPMLRHVVPELVEQLTIAETLVGLGRQQSGYARVVGSGDAIRAAPGGDIRDLRDQVRTRYGRKARRKAV